MKAFGLKGRNPGTEEQKLMRKWFGEYGFTKEIVLEACGRTLLRTHEPSFPYADRILADWHRAGVRTMEDIRLNALFMLTASRLGYEAMETYFDNLNENTTDVVESIREKINHLTDYQEILYVCADSIGGDAIEICGDRQLDLEEDLADMMLNRQLYSIVPYFGGMELTSSWVQEKNGITEYCYAVRGETEYQKISRAFPVFETGNADLNAYLWDQFAGWLYSYSDQTGRLAENGYEPYMKDQINISYQTSLVIPGVIHISGLVVNAPVYEPQRYFEKRLTRMIDLHKRQEIEMKDLFENVDEYAFRQALAEAVNESEDYRAYVDKSIKDDWDMDSSAWSLNVVNSLKWKGIYVEESNYFGVGNYAGTVFVPWDSIRLQPSHYLTDMTAAMPPAEEIDYEWRELADHTVSILRYRGKTENLVIPEKLDGKPVSTLDKQMIVWNNDICTVVIPDSVGTIRREAFFGNKNLTGITIPGSVWRIEENAFRNCENLTLTVEKGSSEETVRLCLKTGLFD